MVPVILKVLERKTVTADDFQDREDAPQIIRDAVALSDKQRGVLRAVGRP